MQKYSERVSHSLRNLIRWGLARSNILTFNSTAFAFQMSPLMVWKSQQSQSSCAGWKWQWRGFRCGVKKKSQQAALNPLCLSCDPASSICFTFIILLSTCCQLIRFIKRAKINKCHPMVVLFPESWAAVRPSWCCWLMLSGLVWSWQWDPHSGPL